jgi:hypothetical protein
VLGSIWVYTHELTGAYNKLQRWGLIPGISRGSNAAGNALGTSAVEKARTIRGDALRLSDGEPAGAMNTLH